MRTQLDGHTGFANCRALRKIFIAEAVRGGGFDDRRCESGEVDHSDTW